MHNAVTGANKTDYHVTGVNIGRDFQLGEVADIRFAVEGDKAPNGSPLVFEKCIEVGHVFKLGTKYSDAMKAHFLDENGKSKPIIMGCYGIGVNRILAAVIEASHDDNGICWPVNIAPFTVEIVALDHREEQVMTMAEKLHDELEAKGIDVLLDDRDARPGFKFKDADLIGIPIRITVGKTWSWTKVLSNSSSAPTMRCRRFLPIALWKLSRKSSANPLVNGRNSRSIDT